MFSRVWSRIRKVRVYRYSYAAISALLLLALLFSHNYFSKYVYVVVLNEMELGVVEDSRDVELFIEDLTARCGELYGVNASPADEILLLKEFRPDSKPSPDLVKEMLRQEMTIVADAFMIYVNGRPYIPVKSEQELEEVFGLLKASYTSEDIEVMTLDAYISGDLSGVSCTVPPQSVMSASAAADILLNGGSPLHSYGTMAMTGQQAPGSDALGSNGAYLEKGGNGYLVDPGMQDALLRTANDNAAVVVSTIEEYSTFESIPYQTIYKYSDELWVVQQEIIVPGEEGLREITYRVTRENGVVVDREKVREITHSHPVTQVVEQGISKVPAMGSGRFIWPVPGGQLTPGRGFSQWHTGIDINAPMGTDILAADSGVVTFSGYGGSQGNYLILYHGDFWTLYLHNQVNLVRPGTQVQKGQVIALLGSTGRSTGPHLHFEVRRDDGTGEWNTYYQHTPIDPLHFFSTHHRDLAYTSDPYIPPVKPLPVDDSENGTEPKGPDQDEHHDNIHDLVKPFEPVDVIEMIDQGASKDRVDLPF